jgi:glycosyltransferase involved in cell wall biosynthesis
VARSIFFYTDSRELGGAEMALLMLIENLDATWRPTLLVDDDPGSQPLAGRAEALGAEVRRVAPMPLGLAGARRGLSLARMLRRERPAVFHAHLSWPLAAKWALAAAVLARRPAVATIQLIPEFELEPSSRRQLRALASRVDRYIAVSRDVREELIERFGWPAGKIVVGYNAVEVTRFGGDVPAGLREQIGGRAKRPLVLTSARLDEQKGHPVLLRAAAELPGVDFVLAGEGPERPALEALAAKLGITDRVRFLGYRSDIADLLAACDVFALPSLYEGSSLAVLEAMAAERPVISSAIGGTDELIDDGQDGLLVPPGDVKRLVSALRQLLEDQPLRRAFAERARRRVEREFTPAVMTQRVEAIYRELDGGTGPPPA